MPLGEPMETSTARRLGEIGVAVARVTASDAAKKTMATQMQARVTIATKADTQWIFPMILMMPPGQACELSYIAGIDESAVLWPNLSNSEDFLRSVLARVGVTALNAEIAPAGALELRPRRVTYRKHAECHCSFPFGDRHSGASCGSAFWS